jgi:hypothetical protein
MVRGCVRGARGTECGGVDCVDGGFLTPQHGRSKGLLIEHMTKEFEEILKKLEFSNALHI